MPENEIELKKNCPFCGGDDIELQWNDCFEAYQAVCNNPNCFATVGYDKDPKKVVKAWNRRVKNGRE